MKIKMFTIPNMITLLNLLSGCMAAFFAFRGDLQFAFYFIALSAVFDFLDGFAARALKAYSPLGKELDSLADVISFGFAPSAMLLSMMQTEGGGLWSLGAFLLAAFSALRLAKFNIDESQSDEFVGLPTPACALLVASIGYLYASGEFTPSPWTVLIANMVLCWLLISPIRMFSFKFHSAGWRGNELRYMFLAASVAAIIFLHVMAIPFIIVGYIVVSTARNLVCKKG